MPIYPNLPSDNITASMLLDIYITITSKNDKPALELRRCTTEYAVIKQLLSATIHNRPISLLPKFTDTAKSLSSACQKGIIYYDNIQNTYCFTF